MADGPLIVQSDRTILLEVDHPHAERAREVLAGFAELVKSPEHVHTYRLSPLSLWNAASAGLRAEAVLADLGGLSRYPVPDSVAHFIREQMGRYGRLRLVAGTGGLALEADDPALLTEIMGRAALKPYFGARTARGVEVDPTARGTLKQALARLGWPVRDEAGYTPGAPLDLDLREVGRDGRPFALRPYQLEAVAALYGTGQAGSGVVVLPCGAGKTLVGLGIMARLKTWTLILTTSVAAAHQWRRELENRTTLEPEQIGEYTADRKDIRPVTLTTYQMLAHRVAGRYPHFELMDQADWGLIIYDEVHLLPAPIFRLTAAIQARRRLGLTATLIREDGHAEDVFALIGPKRYDVPWRELEQQGWIAPAECREIRVDMPAEARMAYATAPDAERARLAGVNPAKLAVVERLLATHARDRILIIGQYLDQLEALAERVGAPLVTGRTPERQRERWYEAFRRGEISRLVVSKVANFAIDLPEANVAIQLSGTFGSRQEEAQRLGRILRPKSDGGTATFYTVVSQDTVEQGFAQKRQLFLTEQGYRYQVAHATATGAPDTSRQPAPVIPFPGRTAHGSAAD
ncbi:MAG: helicase-associated domain-containing protein [Actinomycetia bacterium]|nr:helicase-associated domain-containing protein [Actinomycetes bacterium]